MFDIHDSHTTPEPILVLSALSYLFPAFSASASASTALRVCDIIPLLLLTISSVGFHATRLEWWFALDLGSITLFLLRFGYLSSKCSLFAQSLFVLSVAYGFISYFVGKMYRIMSFDPDWSTQMMFHSMMHVTTAWSAHVIMDELGDGRRATNEAATGSK